MKQTNQTLFTSLNLRCVHHALEQLAFQGMCEASIVGLLIGSTLCSQGLEFSSLNSRDVRVHTECFIQVPT